MSDGRVTFFDATACAESAWRLHCPGEQSSRNAKNWMVVLVRRSERKNEARQNAALCVVDAEAGVEQWRKARPAHHCLASTLAMCAMRSTTRHE